MFHKFLKNKKKIFFNNISCNIHKHNSRTTDMLLKEYKRRTKLVSHTVNITMTGLNCNCPSLCFQYC